MTDEELIARLTCVPADGWGIEDLCQAAADRIAALLARAEAAEAERDAGRETVARLTAENEELRLDAKAYLAVYAPEHARRMGLPDGHLHPLHYDRLAELGCRMTDFTRAALTQKDRADD